MSRFKKIADQIAAIQANLPGLPGQPA